jgi:hypothetical protein
MPLTPVQKKNLETNIRVLNALKVMFEASKNDFERDSAELEREIEDTMIAAELTRYVGKTGEALIIETPRRSWYIDRLEDLLTVRQFKLYCPPTPSSKVLSAYRTSIQLDKDAVRRLDKCCELKLARTVRCSTPEEVEHRAKTPKTESAADAE